MTKYLIPLICLTAILLYGCGPDQPRGEGISDPGIIIMSPAPSAPVLNKKGDSVPEQTVKSDSGKDSGYSSKRVRAGKKKASYSKRKGSSGKKATVSRKAHSSKKKKAVIPGDKSKTAAKTEDKIKFITEADKPAGTKAEMAHDSGRNIFMPGTEIRTDDADSPSSADTNPPVPGGGGSVAVYSIAYNSSVAVTWSAGSDNMTPEGNLFYRLYVSQKGPITDLKVIEESGTPLTDWEAGMTSHYTKGLTPDRRLDFNVAIMDEKGNIALYSNAALEPLFAVIDIKGGSIKSAAANDVHDSGDQGDGMSAYRYLISRWEVTFNEYDYYCFEEGAPFASDAGWGRGMRPAIFVTWHDAVRFCNWLSLRSGFPPAYNRTGQLIDAYGTVTDYPHLALGYRLPTEIEWQYAAGNMGARSGSEYSGGPFPDLFVWSMENSGGRTMPVGTKAPNELGIYDMSGNVFEWCHDWYSEKGAIELKMNPAAGDRALYRALRGGSWYLKSEFSVISRRDYEYPDTKNFNIGFRICRSLHDKP
jgi:hypothetical protein